MFRTKRHIGIAVDDLLLQMARVQRKGKTLLLLDLDTIELAEPLHKHLFDPQQRGESSGQTKGADPDDIFGIEDTGESSPESSASAEEALDNLNELDSLDDLENLADFDSLEDEDTPDLVDEAGLPDSNEVLVYEYLNAAEHDNRKHIGLNIRSGISHFQFLSDTNYSSVKRKELREIVEKRLHSVHGEVPDQDFYNYYVDEEGRLCIVSVDEEPESLRMMNRVHAISKRKRLYIEEVLSDEMALVGFYRTHYPEPPDEKRITALIQIREQRCRIVFLRNHQILQISPIINEGSADRNVLGTLFSKLLFQLDTGKVSRLDRVILCDNVLGEEAIRFFEKQFPDVDVREFEPDPALLQIPDALSDKVPHYTTALATATAAAGPLPDLFPPLSIIPQYIPDRQKIFQLQWHGILLLIAIGLAPVVLNSLYQQNRTEIENLTSENSRMESLIADLESTVEETNQMEQRLNMHKEQLMLLYELSEETVRWTATFDHINRAVSEIGGLWITTFRQSPQGLLIEGYSLYEERIPALARRFGHVTLINVQQVEMREHPIHRFSMRLARVVDSEGLYTPEFSREIPPFLESLEEL
ncbi:MAG: PilN domain-containing protein [Balneolaceae bacterium]